MHIVSHDCLARQTGRREIGAEAEHGFGVVIPADEPDKVSELIVKVINDGAFEFTPEYYISIHARIFKEVAHPSGRSLFFLVRF